LASIHGTVSTILAVQTRAPCSPCMNWLSSQLLDSTPNSSHFSSVQCSIWVPDRSRLCSMKPFWTALAATTASWSTSMDQSRSVSPFHWEVLAFS